MYPPPRSKKKISKRFLKFSKKIFNRKVFLGLFFIFIVFLIVAGIYYLPLVVDAMEEESFPKIESAVILLDNEGEEFYKEYNDYRIKVTKNEVPENIKEGLIVMEDKRFHEHFGVDFRGVMRAVKANIREKSIVQGGSTITQQLARNYFLSHQKTFKRKINELFFTLYLESSLSKDKILEKYLNKIYFGHGAYGIEAASRVYFAKNVDELDLAEKALLVGLVKGPYVYSPYNNKEAARNRRDLVINEMLAEDKITKEKAEKAKNKSIELAGESAQMPENEAHYFAEEVINRLDNIMEEIGKSIYEGGFKVHTTLDKDLQAVGQNIIENNLPVEKKLREETGQVRQPQGALVSIAPKTGEVKVLVGGRDYKESKLNRAVLPIASPGSIFKTYVYAAALNEKEYHPASLVTCEEKEFDISGNGTYKPTDYGGGYHNDDLTIRRAIVESCNVGATTVHKEIGPEMGVKYAERFGVKTELWPWLSFPLGPFEVSPLEAASSHTPLANKGKRKDDVLIEKIEDARGEVIYEKNIREEYVIDERTVYQLTNILQDVISTVGTASTIHDRLDFSAAGKTGTAGEGRGASFVGYTPELVTFVHIRNDDNDVIDGTGGSLAAPLWMDFMEEASQKITFSDFSQPEGMISEKICQESGNIAAPGCPEGMISKDYFVPEKAPREMCRKHLDIPSFPWGIW